MYFTLHMISIQSSVCIIQKIHRYGSSQKSHFAAVILIYVTYGSVAFRKKVICWGNLNLPLKLNSQIKKKKKKGWPSPGWSIVLVLYCTVQLINVQYIPFEGAEAKQSSEQKWFVEQLQISQAQTNN